MNEKNRIRFPELFQGVDKGKDYFEGWYFKHVSEKKDFVFSAIPGISYEDNHKHAFIQLIIGPPFKSFYIQYPIEAFDWQDDPFIIRIGGNTFSMDGINLKIEATDVELKGRFQYDDISRLKHSIIQPNIMGFFAYFRFMQCNHGVMSLTHHLHGRITYNGLVIDFSHGKGYIEKDWGISFPKKYIWIQSNHFEDDSVSIFSSIAHIPFLKRAFLGFIMILKVGNKQYRFATYNRAKIASVKYKDDFMTIEVKRRQHILRIRAKYDKGHVLKAPNKGVMVDDINETLEGVVEVSLMKNGVIIYEGTGTNAGVEVVNWTKRK